MIDVKNLLLTDENPRLDLDEAKEEHMYIYKQIVIDQKDKLINLADDILNKGLSPLDNFAVYPDSTNGNYYRVAEGNRRLAAIISLNNPLLLKQIDQSLFLKLETIIKKTDKTPPRQVACVIYPKWEDQDLQYWIQNRHLGSNEGRGLSQWDSIQKARYRRNQEGKDALLDFWDFLEENNYLSWEEINAVSKTNWERILGRKGQLFFGINKKGDSYEIVENDLDLFKRKIRTAITKLKHETVAIVYDQNKVESFLNEVADELGLTPDQKQISMPLPSIKTESSTEGDKSKGDDNKKLNKEGSKDLEKSKPQLEFKNDIFHNSTTIIPKAHKLKSSNTRINSIIKELKKLEVEEHPNACAALLRLLFELSAKHYIEINNISVNDESIEKLDFNYAITLASDHMSRINAIEKGNKQLIKKEKDMIRQIFNGYMHSFENYPSSHALKQIFKSHEQFISLCLAERK